MTDSFTFNIYDVGQPSQHILFKLGDQPEQRFDVPGLVVSEEPQEKFKTLYAKLIELGAIPNRTGILRPEI